MQAIGTLVMPALRHNIGIINWHQEGIQKLDRKTRKILTIRGQHHLRADTDRIHVARREEGRELMKIK
jgi:hypothetical protein